MTARYGPHDPTTAPTVVTAVYTRRGGATLEQQVDVPLELVRQREQLNARAHRDGATS